MIAIVKAAAGATKCLGPNLAISSKLNEMAVVVSKLVNPEGDGLTNLNKFVIQTHVMSLPLRKSRN